MPGTNGDHCEETKGRKNVQHPIFSCNLSFFTYLSVKNVIRPTDAPCQCQDDREDSNGGGNCEKPLVGVGRNSGKDYCYVTLPSGCKDLEDSPVEGQDGQKISAEACNSGLSTAS